MLIKPRISTHLYNGVFRFYGTISILHLLRSDLVWCALQHRFIDGFEISFGIFG